jgi:hypothetical protein
MKNCIHEELISIHVIHNIDENGEMTHADPYFSKWPCGCCGDYLAGNRYDCKALVLLNRDGRQSHHLLNETFSCCEDCVCKYQ